jgi:hypothetical protein
MPQIFGKTNRAVPTLASDNAQTQVRLSQYGDVITTQLMDNHSTLADEGSYFKVTSFTNAGAITPIAGPVQTTFSLTSGIAAMVTGGTSGKRCYLDYIRLYCTAAGTASTNLNFAISLDSTSRTITGGTTAPTIAPTNVNMDSARTTTLSSFTFGNLTIGAAANARVVFRGVMKTQAAPCMVVGDTYSIDFGEHAQSGSLMSGTNPSAYALSSGPVVFGANSTLVLHTWSTLNSAAASYDFEIGWWER